MSTSPHPITDIPFDQDAPDVVAEPVSSFGESDYPVDFPIDEIDEIDEPAYVDDSYERGPVRHVPRSTVYESLPGMPGRGIIVVAGLATGLVVGLDFALTGSLSYFFDLTFVVICLVAAMAVRGHDLFTSGVLPPLVFGAAIGLVSLLAPTTFVASGGIAETFLTGLTSHAGALVFGYGTALVTVAGRAAHHRHH